MIRAIALTVAMLALSACATTTRYVVTPCVGKDQVLPAEPPRVQKELTGRADEDVRTIAGSAIRLRAYGGALRTIIEGCRG